MGKKERVDAKAVRAWMSRTGIKGCSACGSEKLTVSKDSYALVCVDPVTGGPDLKRGSRVVRLRCGRCAHLMLFHARQMGLG